MKNTNEKENVIDEVKVDNNNETVSAEPLFRIVLPKRRTWFYNFRYRLRGSKFFQALLGPQTKALPAPSQFRI